MKASNLKVIASLTISWLVFLAAGSIVQAQDTTRYFGPIIDMHLHAYNQDNYWGGREHRTGVSSPSTAQKHLNHTQELMEQHNIVKAVIDGRSASILSKLSKMDHFVGGYHDFVVGFYDGKRLMEVETFEKLVKDGTIQVFGEIAAVYFGKTLNDPIYEPYLKICEEYGIPVAYHTGGGPSNTSYNCCPDFRISNGDPLLIEDVLVKYPNLKVYLMHGGEVFYEHAVRMMKQYSQLYIDLGVLLWVDPMVKNYADRLLKLAKNAGVLDRVMFGTDQMVWPGAIEASINFLNDQDYLTKEEKADIFYNNAARFLELSEEEIVQHQEMTTD